MLPAKDSDEANNEAQSLYFKTLIVVVVISIIVSVLIDKFIHEFSPKQTNG